MIKLYQNIFGKIYAIKVVRNTQQIENLSLKIVNKKIEFFKINIKKLKIKIINLKFNFYNNQMINLTLITL